MSLGVIAQRSDYQRQAPDVQQRVTLLLRELDRLRFTCRIEVSGRDLHITIARGLPPASYWLRLFSADPGVDI
jgi:hypothetical protein